MNLNMDYLTVFPNRLKLGGVDYSVNYALYSSMDNYFACLAVLGMIQNSLYEV